MIAYRMSLDPEMFTELHGEEKREEGDRELASNHFLMCAPQSGLLRDFFCNTQEG